MKKLRGITFTLLAVLTLHGCTDNNGNMEAKVPVTGISLNKTTLILQKGGKETLTATVMPADATDRTVSWSSDKPAIASVDPATGEITAMEAGTAEITAMTTDGGKTDVCTVSVDPTVYAAGGEYFVINNNANHRARFWMNGLRQELELVGTGYSSACGVCVLGNDVYVIGDETVNGQNTACLWKNGRKQALPLTPGEESWMNNIFTEGNDLYVTCGEGAPEGTRTIILKNGSIFRSYPNSGNNFPKAACILDSKVIIAGNISQKAHYWEEDVAYALPVPENTIISGAYSVAVSGGDVYMAGDAFVQPGAMVHALLWKNGELHPLENSAGAFGAYSVCESNGNIYVAGCDSGQFATYWENGNMRTLEKDGDISSSAKSIFVLDGDVYVGGSANINENESVDVGRVWKNGELLPMTFPPSVSASSSITIQSIYVDQR